jgi:hypothetical protein
MNVSGIGNDHIFQDPMDVSQKDSNHMFRSPMYGRNLLSSFVDVIGNTGKHLWWISIIFVLSIKFCRPINLHIFAFCMLSGQHCPETAETTDPTHMKVREAENKRQRARYCSMSPEQVEALRQYKRSNYLKRKAVAAGSLQKCGSLIDAADVGSTPTQLFNGIFLINTLFKIAN